MATAPPPSPRAGWYPDPAGGSGRRYWDGTRWCDFQPSPPRSKLGWVVIGVAIAVLVFGIAAACIAGANNVTKHEGGTTYPDDWECIDPTPVKDGACKVSHGGLLDTGLSAGWIRSAGPRPGSTACEWRRLDGPSTGLEHIIDAGNEKTGPIDLHIKSDDYAFWSKGCQPWQRISHD